MSDKFKNKFSGLKDKFKLPATKPSAEELDTLAGEELTPTESVSGASISTKEKYQQLLNNIVINGLLNIAEDKLNDDVFIESVFNKAYELLPTPIRLVMKREWCLNYLNTHKAPLLEQLKDYRAKRPAEVEPLVVETLPTPVEVKPAL